MSSVFCPFRGLLQRYPVTASGLHLIGKETERGWEDAEDISTLLPSLIRYQRPTGIAMQDRNARLARRSAANLAQRPRKGNWF